MDKSPDKNTIQIQQYITYLNTFNNQEHKIPIELNSMLLIKIFPQIFCSKDKIKLCIKNILQIKGNFHSNYRIQITQISFTKHLVYGLLYIIIKEKNIKFIKLYYQIALFFYHKDLLSIDQLILFTIIIIQLDLKFEHHYTLINIILKEMIKETITPALPREYYASIIKCLSNQSRVCFKDNKPFLLLLSINDPQIKPLIYTFLNKIFQYNYDMSFMTYMTRRVIKANFWFKYNSIDFIKKLIEEEEQTRKKHSFYIKKGFVLQKDNTPLTIDHIPFDTKEFTIIFSFKYSSPINSNEKVTVFSIETNKQPDNKNKDIPSEKVFSLNIENDNLSICKGENDIDHSIPLERDHDYMIVLTQRPLSNAFQIWKKYEFFAYINQRHIKTKTITCLQFLKEISFIFGKNFNGILGSFHISKRSCELKEIEYIFSLSEDYDFITQITNDLNLLKPFSSRLLSKDPQYHEALNHFKSNTLPIDFSIFPSYVHRLMKHDDKIKLNKRITLNKNNEGQFTIQAFRQFTIFQFLKYQGLKYITLLFGLLSCASNDDINLFISTVLKFLLDLISTLGSKYFNNEHNILLTIIFNYISTKSHEKTFKINLCLFQTLLEKMNYSNIGDDIDIRNCLVKLLSDKNIYEFPLINDNLISLFTSITTCLKSNPTDLMTKGIMKQLLNYSSLLEDNDSAKGSYRKLLNEFHMACVENNKTEALEPMINFLLRNNDMPSSKRYIMLKMIYIHIGNQSIVKDSNELSHMMTNVLESTLSFDECKWDNLSLCIIYLIFIDCINKKMDPKSLFKLPIKKLCFKYPFMLTPTIEFFKSVLIDLFPDTSPLIKAKFIQNKASLQELTFPMKNNAEIIKKKLISIEKYLEIIIEKSTNEYYKSSVDQVNSYFQDFIKELLNYVKSKNKEEKQFLEAIMTSQAMNDYMLFCFNKNISQATLKLLINIIEITFPYINKPFYFKFLCKLCHPSFTSITKENDISAIIVKLTSLLCTENNEHRTVIILWNQINFLYSLNQIIKSLSKKVSEILSNSIITFLNFLSTQNIILTKVRIKFRLKEISCIELVFDTVIQLYRNSNGEEKMKELMKKILIRSEHSLFYYMDINYQLFKDFQYLGTQSDYSFCVYFLNKLLNNCIEEIASPSFSFLHEINEIIFKDIILLASKPKTKALLNKANLPKENDYWKVIDFFDKKQLDKSYKTIKDFHYEWYKDTEIKKIKGMHLNVSKRKSSQSTIHNEEIISIRKDSETTITKFRRNLDLTLISDSDFDITNETLNFNKKRALSHSTITYQSKHFLHTLLNQSNITTNQENQHNSDLILINDNDKESLQILFNLKRNLIWNTFPFIYKDQIFKNKTFISMKNIYNAHYSNKIENSVLRDLNYPIKVKNYTCKSFYMPFVKPDIKFYSNPLIAISHPYFIQDKEKKNLLEQFAFLKIIPTMKNIAYKSHCELITKIGSIFGEITLNQQYICFIATPPEKDIRFTNGINYQQKMPYVFSSDEHDNIKSSNKKLLIYIGDIEEILSRRYFFQWIAVELFINTRQSYFINFFSETEKNKFIDELNKIPLSSSLSIVSDLYKGFKKNNYARDWQNNKLSTFEYMLMVNKYSCRSYNDTNQYPILPWLTLDTNTCLRDLSRPIYDQYEKKRDYFLSVYKKNSNINKFHYSTSGYVLYYLIRSNPYTYSLIKFQSNKFDLASRIFTSIQDSMNIFFSSGETREIIPEFFYDYNFLINLNRNDFGFLEVKGKRLNDVLSQNKSSYQYIADLRVLINQSNTINLWINNIFGVYQMKPMNQNSMTMFHKYTYEKNNVYAKKIEKWEAKNLSIEEIYNKIRGKINLSLFGNTPYQLFHKGHPTKKINYNNNSVIDTVKNEYAYENIKQFLKTVKGDKFRVVIKKNLICFKFLSSLEIFTLNTIKDKKESQRISIAFPKQGHLRFRKESFCQLSNGLFALCRFFDNTIRIYDMNNKDYKHIIQCDTLITSICSIKNDSFITGDVEGFICKWNPINQAINNSSKFSYRIHQRIIGHECEVLLIHYDERLDILLSIDEKNICVLHNLITMDLINIIEVEHKIHDVKISFQDFIFFLCDSGNSVRMFYIYSLNGLLIEKTQSGREIAGFELSKDSSEVIIAQGDVVYKNNIFNIDLLRKGYVKNKDYLFTLENDKIVKEMIFWKQYDAVLFVFTDNTIIIKHHHYH